MADGQSNENSNSPKHRKALIWIIRTEPAAVLLLKTVPERGNRWQPITGSIEKGETVEEGAARELREETTLTLKNGDLIPLGITTEFVSRFGPTVETSYTFVIRAKSPTKVKIDPKEHTQYQWTEPSHALDLIPYQNQKDSLKKALELAGLK